MMVNRVEITPAAAEVVARLKAEHGPLMFHQSGGCCDGSQPMCFAAGEFRVGGSDVWIGSIEDCPFYMNESQFEYWKHTHLTIDITSGRGSSFSLEIPLGLRFIVHSRIFSEEELTNLTPVVRCE
jgi:uncharacterized protein (DUF779 family)